MACCAARLFADHHLLPLAQSFQDLGLDVIVKADQYLLVLDFTRNGFHPYGMAAVLGLIAQGGGGHRQYIFGLG